MRRRLAIVTVLGFSSGLPLALTDSTLQAWLTVSGVDITTIGMFSLLTIPYVFKFLWAPLLDRFVPRWLGRRRGWMALSLTSERSAFSPVWLGAARYGLATMGFAVLFALRPDSEPLAVLAGSAIALLLPSALIARTKWSGQNGRIE